MRIADALLLEYDHEMANTRRVLERVPDSKWSYKPHAKSFSMGELASHVANLPHWLTTVVTEDQFDVMPGGKPHQSPRPGTSQELLKLFDESVAAGRAALAGAADDQLMKPWALLANGQEIFRLPRTGVIRSFAFNHLLHHRGQLTVYLRLNDIPLPGLYGPSADES